MPKFHISVASLSYRDTFTGEIVGVPIIPKTKTEEEDCNATDIFKFTTMYSETCSDGDDDGDEGIIKVNNSNDCIPVDEECASSISREQLDCTLIECAIGNRKFRFTAASLRDSREKIFIEEKNKEEAFDSITGLKRKIGP